MKTILLSRAVTAGLERALEGYQYGGHSSGPGITPQTDIIIPRPPPDPVPPPAGYDLNLWTHDRLQGTSLTLHSGESYRDLRYVGWWIFAQNWNDQITSVDRTASLCLAYEHINFQGSLLWLGPRQFVINNLTNDGWNDRISSVINSG